MVIDEKSPMVMLVNTVTTALHEVLPDEARFVIVIDPGDHKIAVGAKGSPDEIAALLRVTFKEVGERSGGIRAGLEKAKAEGRTNEFVRLDLDKEKNDAGN
jgi:hypothetical protein